LQWKKRPLPSNKMIKPSFKNLPPNSSSKKRNLKKQGKPKKRPRKKKR